MTKPPTRPHAGRDNGDGYPAGLERPLHPLAVDLFARVRELCGLPPVTPIDAPDNKKAPDHEGPGQV